MIKLVVPKDVTMDHGSTASESLQQVTAAVQQQYERFPYPPVPIEQAYQGFSQASSYSLAQYARTRRWLSPQGKRALIAGCGTGYEIQVVAGTNPGLEQIWGIDISEASLQLAQQRLHYHRLTHCQVQPGDLMDANSLPQGPFDLIESYGVLHHTADPVQALQALATRLAPDGVMAVMLYNRRGRMVVYHTRQVLATLGIDRLPTEKKIEFTRDLLSSFTPGSLFDVNAQLNKEYYKHDENIIDNYFHANDLPFDVAEIPDFLAQANLEFLDIIPPHYEPSAWDPTTVVSATNREFYRYYDQLPRIEQLSVIELLSPLKRSDTIFWCCHAGAQEAASGFSREWFQASSWQLNPQFIRYGEIAYLDQRISVSQVCQSDPQVAQIPATHLTLYWPLFSNQNRSRALSLFQLQQVLLPLAASPQTGAQILERWPTDLRDHLLKCCQTWEQYRILVRI